MHKIKRNNCCAHNLNMQWVRLEVRRSISLTSTTPPRDRSGEIIMITSIYILVMRVNGGSGGSTIPFAMFRFVSQASF